MPTFMSGRCADLFCWKISSVGLSIALLLRRVTNEKENTYTQEIVKLWHTTTKQKTLERPLAHRALLCHASPIHSTVTSGWSSAFLTCLVLHYPTELCMFSLHPQMCRQVHHMQSTRSALEESVDTHHRETMPQLMRDRPVRSQMSNAALPFHQRNSLSVII